MKKLFATGGMGGQFSWGIVLIGIIAIVVLFWVTTALFVLRGKEQVRVPVVEGANIVSAIIALQEQGLIPHIRLAYQANQQEPHTVLRQTPPAGAHVRVGKRVTLEVNYSDSQVVLDSFIGNTLAEVEARLAEYQLSHNIQIIINSTLHVADPMLVGTVIAQDPPAGTQVANYSTIDLVISKGE